MVTQKPVNQTQALVLPNTEAGMLARVDEAKALAPMWAKDMTQNQRHALAVIALAYGLDPLMDELILYQGKPMITIKGRRRKDAEAGHHPDIRMRFLTDEEKRGFLEDGAMQEGDLAGYCVLTTEWRNTVEGFGKVTKAERASGRQPVARDNPIEMRDKRAEARAREMAYGPLPRPQLPLGLAIIESEGHIVEELPAPPQAGQAAPQASRSTPRRQAAQQERPAPEFCTIHGDIRLGKHPDLGMVHKLADGSFCTGLAASTAASTASTADDDGLPPGTSQDQAELEAAVLAANYDNVDDWCREFLRVPNLAAWRATGKTLAQAWVFVPGYKGNSRQTGG